MVNEITPATGQAATQGNGETMPMTPTFIPAVDIFERGDTTVILANMPGVAPEDVEVTLERQLLTLRGRLKQKPHDGFRQLTAEYREGDYSRVFTLSDEVDMANIDAHYANGVLRLVLPRSAALKPKKITVKAA